MSSQVGLLYKCTWPTSSLKGFYYCTTWSSQELWDNLPASKLLLRFSAIHPHKSLIKNCGQPWWTVKHQRMMFTKMSAKSCALSRALNWCCVSFLRVDFGVTWLHRRLANLTLFSSNESIHGFSHYRHEKLICSLYTTIDSNISTDSCWVM